MKRFNVYRFTVCIILVFSTFVFIKRAGAGVLTVDHLSDDISLGPYIDYFEDKSGLLSINQVIESGGSIVWSASKWDELNYGFSTSVYFLKIRLKNKESKSFSRFLDISYPLLNYIQIFFVRDGKVVKGYLLGDKFPFHARLIENKNFLIPVDLSPGESLDIVFRIKSNSSIQIPLHLLKEKTVMKQNQIRNLGYGLYYGAMIAMIFYNLIVFMTIREGRYLYYVFFVSSMALLLFTLNGFSYQYLWPDCTWWNGQAVAVFICCVDFFGLLFIRLFLDLPDSDPFMDKACNYLAVILGVFIGISIVLPYEKIISSVIFISLVMIVFAIYAGITKWFEGYSSARLYVLSWLGMLIGGIVLALNKLGLIIRNGFTENSLQIGSAMEILLLSFALADRLSQEKTKRFNAQRSALKNEKLARTAQAKALKHEIQARLAHEQALLIQKKANENLENSVRLRTRELEIVNSRLRELSTTDSLTGLKNRRYFNEIYYKEYNRSVRDNTPLSFLIMDIDRFKKINDTFGHLVGDECLKEVASAIQKQLLRDNDFLARYGGEEFCVLLTNTPSEGALQVAENIRSCVERLKLKKNGITIPLTISIGIASETPDLKINAESLLSNADSALYQSKTNGRNRVTLYDQPYDDNDEPWIQKAEVRYRELKQKKLKKKNEADGDRTLKIVDDQV